MYPKAARSAYARQAAVFLAGTILDDAVCVRRARWPAAKSHGRLRLIVP
jgi:hypothetical protein